MHPPTRAGLALLCLLIAHALAAPASAEVYRWVEDDGTVHFSETPPEGQQAETVELPPAPARGASEDAPGANPPPGDRPAAAPDTEAADPVEAWRQRRQENCQRARANLRVLQGPGRVAMPQDGGQKVLSEAERGEQIEEARRQIQVFCE